MLTSTSLDNEELTLEDLGGSVPVASTVPTVPTAAVSKPSTTHKGGRTSAAEDRALTLLGSGVSAESVAAALGVTPSRIAQLMGDADFAERVAALRYENLQSHNTRDALYDGLEDKLLSKLEKSLPFLIKPEAILKAISTINNAKRRGQSAPDQTVNQQSIVSLIMPTVITQKFAVNINNQVVKAGEQDLLTMPSGNLLDRVNEASAKKLENKGEQHDSQGESSAS